MAIDKEHIASGYPLPVYNYRVVVDGSETMAFSEISGLEIEHDHILYRHGVSWLMGDHLIRGQRKPINVTLRRGVVKQRKYLYDWLRSEEKKNIRIEMCDEKGEAIISWDVSRALPYKLDAPAFNASNSDVAIESLDLIAHDLRITHVE